MFFGVLIIHVICCIFLIQHHKVRLGEDKHNIDILYSMDRRAAIMTSNIIVSFPKLSHGDHHLQITSCELLSLPGQTLQTKIDSPPNYNRYNSNQPPTLPMSY